MNTYKKFGLFVTSFALVATLAACSDDKGSSTEQTTEQTQADETASESTESDGATDTEADTADTAVEGISTSGSYEATLDGQPFVVDEEMVACVVDGSEMTLAVGPESPTDDANVITVHISNDAVQAVAMGATSGAALVYGPGTGSADLTVDGNTYTIIGEGMYADMNNPGIPENKPFEVKITCD